MVFKEKKELKNLLNQLYWGGWGGGVIQKAIMNIGSQINSYLKIHNS